MKTPSLKAQGQQMNEDPLTNLDACAGEAGTSREAPWEQRYSLSRIIFSNKRCQEIA